MAAHASYVYQKWQAVSTSDGYMNFNIYPGSGNTFRLDIPNGENADNLRIILHNPNTSDAQKYKLQRNSDGTFTILTKCSNFTKCVDGQPGSTSSNANGVKIQQCTYVPGDLGQRWYFYEMDMNESNTEFIKSTATYTANKNYMQSSTDARGKTTSYQYDPIKGVLNSVTDPLNRTTSYGYDANTNQLKSVTAGGMTNSYTYQNDRLTDINVNNAVRYKLEYDALGRSTGVKVGNGTQYRQLSTNEYNAAGLLSKQRYGNGKYFTYAYDSLERLREKRYNGSSSQRVTYLYGSDGKLGQITDYFANLRTNYIYDLSGRLVSVREYSGTELYRNDLRSRADYTYADKTNYLTREKYVSALGTLDMSYVYGDLGLGQRPDAVYSVKLHNQEHLRYSYDALGRLSGRTIAPINKTQSYAYVQGNYGAKSTTTLVGSVTSDGEVTSYEYDAAGNITAIKKNGTVWESYEYDSLNQLTKVTCQNGDVYTYAYAGNGNLSEVKKNGETVKSYGYTDGVWKDLLTAFNGRAITYDEIGNPLRYHDGKTFSWQNGRQLAGITDGGTSILYTYNGDGIRTGKTVGGVSTEYIVVDGRLLGEHSGEDYIVYLYDEAGRKYGFTYRSAWYYYRLNLQGDVTGIYNAAGQLVVEYTYDAWGAPLSVTGPLADTIGQVNPIRYRGYYYDVETGFYYVSSRYYDPEVGRWINADGVIAGVGESIQGYNLFVYCFNNPVNMSDDSGHWPKWLENAANWVNDKIVQPVKKFVSDVIEDVKKYSLQGTTQGRYLT